MRKAKSFDEINPKTRKNKEFKKVFLCQKNKSEIFLDTIKYVNREEWDKLRSGIDNYRDKLIIEVLYATGIRIGELAKLRIEDIDFKERFTKIPAENTKTKTGRTVWVPKELLNEIKAYLKLTKKESGRL